MLRILSEFNAIKEALLFLLLLPALAIASPLVNQQLTEINDYYPNWSQLLQEGNIDSFIYELENIVKCYNNNKNENSMVVLSIHESKSCQNKISDILSHKNKKGEVLLKQLFYVNNLREKQLNLVLKYLDYIGMDLYGLNQNNSDNALFFAAENKRLFTIIFLKVMFEDKHSDMKNQLPYFKSGSGETIADILLRLMPDFAGLASFLNINNLAPDLSKLKSSESIAYLTLKYSRIKTEL